MTQLIGAGRSERIDVEAGHHRGPGELLAAGSAPAAVARVVAARRMVD
jgi:hypothetical protein